MERQVISQNGVTLVVPRVPPFPVRVGEDPGCLDRPLVSLVAKLCRGNLDGVSSEDLEFAGFVVERIHQATGRYAVRAIVERGWPSPTRSRCGLTKNLHRRGMDALREAKLVTDDGKSGEAERWLVTRDQALAWLDSPASG